MWPDTNGMLSHVDYTMYGQADCLCDDFPDLMPHVPVENRFCWFRIAASVYEAQGKNSFKSLLVNHKHVDPILQDLAVIVKTLSSEKDCYRAMDLWKAKWISNGEELFIRKFARHYGECRYFRSQVPPGYPIVDPLQQFIKVFREEATDERQPPIRHLLTTCVDFLRERSEFSDEAFLTDPLQYHESLTKDEKKKTTSCLDDDPAICD